jgi:hypothetical protein
MVDGEDSGRFKQVVPSDEEFVPGSVEGSVEGDDDSERANDDAESKRRQRSRRKTTRSRGRSGGEPRRRCRGIAVFFGAAAAAGGHGSAH